jgi:RimJ/RimL family protein N-acetyltransferase
MQVFLETQRLVLRRFTMADVDNLVSLDADPDVMHFITGDVEYALDRADWERRQQAGRAGAGTPGEARG